MKNKPYFVYIVRCQNGFLYTGIAVDIVNRLNIHNSGKGSKACRSFGLPVSLEYSIKQPNKSAALKLEYSIKRLSRKQKQNLINNNKPGNV